MQKKNYIKFQNGPTNATKRAKCDITHFLDKTALKFAMILPKIFLYTNTVGTLLRSTVRLRFRKSISGHHFQTNGKLASIDFGGHPPSANLRYGEKDSISPSTLILLL